MQKVDKEFITKRFSASLKDYDSSATVQKTMAAELVRSVMSVNTNFNRIFEVGCGTGRLTKEICSNLKFNEFFCNDLSQETFEFIDNLCKRDNFFAFDGEQTEQYPDKLDLIVSGAVFQWFENLPQYLNKVSDKLKKKGLIAFSTFGSEQYCEIRQITGNCLRYFTENELSKLISEKFDVVLFHEWKQILKFNSVKEIMSHIKETGVSGIGSKASKKMPLTEFRKKYREQFLKNGELPLTYNPQIWILRRK